MGRKRRCALFYLLAMNDLNAEFHVGLLRDAEDMVVDVLPEARYAGGRGAAGRRRQVSLVAAAAARRVNAHAHEHFRVVDDNLFPLVPRVRVAHVLDAAQPDALAAGVVADRKWLVEECRERAVATTVACCICTHAPFIRLMVLLYSLIGFTFIT